MLFSDLLKYIQKFSFEIWGSIVSEVEKILHYSAKEGDILLSESAAKDFGSSYQIEQRIIGVPIFAITSKQSQPVSLTPDVVIPEKVDHLEQQQNTDQINNSKCLCNLSDPRYL